jgi:hypothetical protein
MGAETKTRSLDDGKFLGLRQRPEHQKILAQGGRNSGMAGRKKVWKAS